MIKRLRSLFVETDRAFIRITRVLSVKARFFLMVIIISVAPILSIGIISYIEADRDIVVKISEYSLQLVKQLGTNINNKLLNWKQYGDIIAISQDVQDYLADFENMTDDRKYLEGKTVENTMKESLKVSLDIQEPDIVTNSGYVISPSANNTSPFVNNLDKTILNDIKEISKRADGSYIWYTGNIANNGYIILSRSIKDINTFKKSMGFLMLQVSGSYLSDLYSSITFANESQVYLVDTEFMIVSGRDRGDLGKQFSPEISKSIKEKYEAGYSNATIKNADGKYLAAFSKIPESGWTVVALIPNSYLSSLSNDIRNIVAFIGGLCLIVSLLFFILIYRSLTIPLNQLIKSMREVRKGNLEARKVDEEANDEVGEVSTSYNMMIQELNRHIDDIKAKEKQKASAEFRALQAQINPHFLANTLNNVAWLARMQKAENIETVVTSLVRLLNVSMGRGSDLITLREETGYLMSYVRIQEFKNFRNIDVRFDIDGDIMDFKILKLILQPIVENSIIHGLGPKQGQGLISVKGYLDGGDVKIIITDTGAGMDENEMERLLRADKGSTDRLNGIGLNNVNERIKLSYGDGYGLSINSRKGVFTSVEVKLPVIR